MIGMKYIVFFLILLVAGYAHAIPRRGVPCSSNLMDKGLTPVLKIRVCSNEDTTKEEMSAIEAEIMAYASCAFILEPDCALPEFISSLERICINTELGTTSSREQCGCDGPAAACYIGHNATEAVGKQLNN